MYKKKCVTCWIKLPLQNRLTSCSLDATCRYRQAGLAESDKSKFHSAVVAVRKAVVASGRYPNDKEVADAIIWKILTTMTRFRCPARRSAKGRNGKETGTYLFQEHRWKSCSTLYHALKFCVPVGMCTCVS